MTISAVLDLVGALVLLLGAALCFAASVGLIRFPDVLSRMHASTKPQTLGLLLVVTGVAISLREVTALGLLLLVAVLQLLTAPVAAHMVARTAYRTNQLRSDLTKPDELGHDLVAAGFRLGVSNGQSDPDRDEDGSPQPGRPAEPSDDSIRRD